MNYGFVKVASAIPSVRVADCRFNIEQIESLILQASGRGVEIVCFPELSISSYSCQDLFHQQLLLDETELALIHLMNCTRGLDIISIVGLPMNYKGVLLNCAAVIQRGKILGVVPKTYLPNYKEFNERRWFTSAGDITPGVVRICGQQIEVASQMLFHTPSCTFGIEISEDLWAPIPPSSELTMNGAEIIFNLSATNDVVGKYGYLKSLVAQQSARTISGYVLSSCGFGESTQDVVFGSKGLIYENGKLLGEAERHSISPQMIEAEIDVERIRAERKVNNTFTVSSSEHKNKQILEVDTEIISLPELRKLSRKVNPLPFIPEPSLMDERCKEVFSIQTEGLAKRLLHTNAKTAVIGISGGLDSTLALLVTVNAFDFLERDRKNIVGVTMPGFGTTDRTYSNALRLMSELGITTREISIKEACMQHFSDLGHDPAIHDTTYENAQARERTQVLMDVANQMDGLVIGTGDLSELALGWATYNGDHMSMYGVNASVPKTLVRHIVVWYAQQEGHKHIAATLLDVVNTPISPELIPANPDGETDQKTEDLVGPYELHDFFLYYMLKWGFRPDKILFLAEQAFDGKYTHDALKKWLSVFCKRFFAHQFKRSCLPDGPKVGSCSLSPRGDWRMPSDASSNLWLNICEEL